jgi:hypothetical protein
MYLASLLSPTPPKSPERGLIMKLNPLYPPFGGNCRGALFNRTLSKKNPDLVGLIYFSTLCVLFVTAISQAFPLDSAYARGDSCLNVAWVPDSLNTKPDWYVQNGSLCIGSDTVYRHCDFTAGVAYHSIAYSYGGEDPYFTFREKLARGLLAGSHLCHYQTVGDPSPYVAGTDCSGFACYLWNVPRVSTAGLVSNPLYQKIQKSQLQPGDLLVNAGSHAVFIVDKDDSTHFVIWEATSAVNGCRERVVDITDAAWAPYVAIRNPGITKALEPAGSSVIKTPLLGSVIAGHGNKSLCLRLNRPFSGDLALYSLNGERINSDWIDRSAGIYRWELPASLSNGMYVIVLRSVDKVSESCTFAIIK